MYKEHNEENFSFIKMIIYVIGIYYIIKLALFIGVFMTNIIE